MSSLINKKHVKMFILEKIASMRPGWKATRVSKEAMDALEAKLKSIIVAQVSAHPTKGITFKP